MKRINRIGIKQTAKFFAVFYFFVSLVFVLPISLIAILAGGLSGEDWSPFPMFGGFFLLLIPVFYAAVGFIMVAIFSLIYNLLAKKFGGIEIELTSESE